MNPRRPAALAAALAICACAPSRFVSPARGGPAWRELQSEHFVLHTDLDREAASEGSP